MAHVDHGLFNLPDNFYLLIGAFVYFIFVCWVLVLGFFAVLELSSGP